MMTTMPMTPTNLETHKGGGGGGGGVETRNFCCWWLGLFFIVGGIGGGVALRNTQLLLSLFGIVCNAG